MEHGSDGDTDYNLYGQNSPQMLGKETGRVRNQKTSRDHPDSIISKISQNIEKSPGDLWIFTVPRTIVKDPQLTPDSQGTIWPYLPTPPLWQDMTKGQFLSGV